MRTICLFYEMAIFYTTDNIPYRGKNRGKEKSGKIKMGKNLVTCENLVIFPRLKYKFSHFFPRGATPYGRWVQMLRGPKLGIPRAVSRYK